MSSSALDEYDLRAMSKKECLCSCQSILRNEKDESLRWDAVWLAGEIAEIVDSNDPIFKEVEDLMSWVLQNDENAVVKHEACYQIAARNMRKRIPELINAALHDKSPLVIHEAIEALGLLNAFESLEVLSNFLDDPDLDIRQTAKFVVRRLNLREKNNSKT